VAAEEEERERRDLPGRRGATMLVGGVSPARPPSRR
jgi:hypothetical protein